MKVDDIFPRRFANGGDLQGKARAVVIDRAQQEKVYTPGASDERKWILYVAGGHKGIVLSRTLALQIAEATGEQDIDKWPGQRITLYPEPMTVAGKPRIAIRARAAANGNGQASQ